MTDRAVPAAFDGATSAIVCDAPDRMGPREQSLDPAIQPLWPGARLVGFVMPVVVVCDESMPDQPYAGEMAALDALAPGEVPMFEIERARRRGVPAAGRGRAAVRGGARSGVASAASHEAEAVHRADVTTGPAV